MPRTCTGSNYVQVIISNLCGNKNRSSTVIVLNFASDRRLIWWPHKQNRIWKTNICAIENSQTGNETMCHMPRIRKTTIEDLAAAQANTETFDFSPRYICYFCPQTDSVWSYIWAKCTVRLDHYPEHSVFYWRAIAGSGSGRLTGFSETTDWFCRLCDERAASGPQPVAPIITALGSSPSCGCTGLSVNALVCMSVCMYGLMDWCVCVCVHVGVRQYVRAPCQSQYVRARSIRSKFSCSVLVLCLVIYVS